MMKTLFIPCSFDGLQNAGSIRVRAEWVAHHWEGADVYNRSQPLAGWDLYVFQKAYLTESPRLWIRTVARWRDEGACRLAFDLCDPDFLDDEHRQRMLGVLPLFDFAVAPTLAMADWMEQYLPVHVIPDRVDIEEVQGYGAAQLTDSVHPVCVWAGYSRNMAALEELRPMVEEAGLPLRTLEVDRSLPFAEFWRRTMATGEILLNPRPSGGRLSYKSDNKTLIAWALGMPVARTAEDLQKLTDPHHRRAEVVKRATETALRHDVTLSVAQWRGLAAKYFKERT